MQFLEFTKKWKGDFGFPPSQMHFAPTKFATGGCSGPGQVSHFRSGFFLYLTTLLTLIWDRCIQVFWLGESVGSRRRTWRGGESPNQRRWSDLWDNKSHPHWFLKSILRTFLEEAAARSHFQASLTLILQNCCQKESRSFSWTFVQRSNLLSFILRLVSISQSGFWSAFMLLAMWCP